MTRTDVLTRISTLVRSDHFGALWAVGYLVQDLDEEALAALLSSLEELSAQLSRPDHYEAYRERWGRIPDPQ